MKSSIFIWMAITVILTDFGSSFAQTYDLAKSIEFERKIFHSNSVEEKRAKLFSKYEFLKNSQAFGEALATLNRIDLAELDSAQLCEFYFQKSLIQSLMKNFAGAMINVNEYCAVCHSLGVDKKKLRLVVLLENQHWEKFNQLVQEDSSFKNKIKLQKPTFLEAESFVRSAAYLPGLGLMRLGEAKKGVASLGLCVGALGFTAYNIATGFYLTSFLSGFDPFLKFYKGGKRLTEALVDEKNEKKANLMKQTGLRFIREHYF